MSISQSYILPAKGRKISFKESGEKRIFFLVPEKCQIQGADFRISGQPLEVAVSLTENSGAGIDPSPGKVTIDFNQMRTVHRVRLGVSSLGSVDTKHLACILRAWGGTQWYLPLPVNLLTFSPKGSGAEILRELPPLKAEKLMLNLARLKKPEAGASYIDLSSLPMDDLMEIMNFESTKAVEEEANIQIDTLTVETRDTLSALTLGLSGKPPLHVSPGNVTATEERPQAIPELADALKEAVSQTPPQAPQDLDLPENLRSALPKERKYHLSTLEVSSTTSGILVINTLSLKHVFLEKTTAKEEGQPQESSHTLVFKATGHRRTIEKQSVYAALPRPSKIKNIAFTIKGSLAPAERISPETIFPKPKETKETLGIQGTGGEKIYSFFKADRPLSLEAVEIRTLTQPSPAALSILRDSGGKPDLNTPPLAISAQASPQETKEGPPENSWIRFDFAQPPLIQQDTPFWLCLEVISGSLSWQAEATSGGEGPFVFRQDLRGLIPCGPHLDTPITLTARYLHLADSLEDHLSIGCGPLKAGIPLKELSRIETEFQQAMDLPVTSPFRMDFISRSEGKLTLSHIRITYEDQNNPVLMVIQEP